MLTGKYLNKYYKKYFWYFIIGGIALIAVDYFQLFIPEYLGQIVDLLDQGSSLDINTIKDIIIGIIAVAIVMFFGRMLWRFTIFYASINIEGSIRHEMFLKSERLSQRYYHENKVGTIMAWFSTDLETIEEYLGWGTIMIIDSLFLSVLVIYRMFNLDAFLAIMTLVPMIFVIMLGAWVEKHMAKNWDYRQMQFDRLYDFAQENFSGIRIIKAFVKEMQERLAFSKIARDNQEANLKFVKTAIIFEVFITLIISIIMSLLIGIGGLFVYSTVMNKDITIFNIVVSLQPGKLVTFIGYFESLVWPMVGLGQLVSMYSRSTASLKRITRFLDEEEEISSDKNAYVFDQLKGKITFNHYNFTYPSSTHPSLKDITFTIKEGESIGIVGKIGSGKSTLVNSLLRLYNVERNQILIDDHDIMDINIHNLRSFIAYVPQDNFLFSDTIRNNIAFSSHDIDDEYVKEAAMFADVHSNIQDFPLQYETITGERGMSLSGGQKQRISIARAYIKDAPIMILDDSVSAVDVKTEETIMNNIKTMRKGKTTIVIASRISTVSSLDKILVLNEGKVEAFDSHDNLLKISPTYQKMVFLQELEREVNEHA